MRIEHGNMKETLKPNPHQSFFTHAADATDAALATDAADAVARTEVWIWSCEFPTQFLSKILNVPWKGGSVSYQKCFKPDLISNFFGLYFCS